MTQECNSGTEYAHLALEGCSSKSKTNIQQKQTPGYQNQTYGYQRGNVEESNNLGGWD